MDKDIQVADDLKEPMKIAQVFFESGIFPDVKSQAIATVKIIAGNELGFTPFQSMANIFIVNGRIGLSSNAMASMVKRSKKYDYSVISLSYEECEIEFFDISEPGVRFSLGKNSFTKTDAAKSGLINKDNYKNWPKNMMFARALSSGVRFYCPDAISGYYVEEELDDIFNIDNKKTITLTKDGEVLSEGNLENYK